MTPWSSGRSKRTIALILITVGATFALSTVVAIILKRSTNVHIPSLGTLKTLGVEAYWDEKLENKTQTINWGTIWPGSSKNITLHVRSTSNLETTLTLTAANWSPNDISNYLNLSWNYNGTLIHPNDVTQVTLTLSASSSDAFVSYLISNQVKQFSLDITISTRES